MTIRFLFDYISPYAHVAWGMLPALAARHGRAISCEPVLFAGILDGLGTKGPAEVPARRVYAFKDAARKAARAGLPPLVPPPAHPYNPLLALRLTMGLPAEQRPPVMTALYRAAWSTGAGIADEASVRAALSGVLPDVDAALARAADPAVKQALKAATDAALASGVFGVPTFIVDGELFFGVDGMDALNDFLAGKDPIDPRQLERWASLPVGARRKGQG